MQQFSVSLSKSLNSLVYDRLALGQDPSGSLLTSDLATNSYPASIREVPTLKENQSSNARDLKTFTSGAWINLWIEHLTRRFGTGLTRRHTRPILVKYFDRRTPIEGS